MTADWLIGCDGAHRAVRHGLGMEFAATTEPSDWLLADVHLEGSDAGQARPVLAHRGRCWRSFPITGNRYRVIADVGRGAGRRPPRRPDAGGGAGAGRPARAGRHPAARSDLARRLPHQRAQGEGLQPRAGVPGRRRRARPQPGRRPGHEHRHAGRLQPQLEARHGDPRRGEAVVARQLFHRAQRGRRRGAAQCRPHDARRHHAQSDRPGGAQFRRPHRAGRVAGAASHVRHPDGARHRVSAQSAVRHRPSRAWQGEGRGALAAR